MSNFCIVGGGFSGTIIAQYLARQGFQVDVFETRSHLAGNCHTARDSETGVMVHTYGPHIFHTDSEQAWSYINEYTTFMPYTNKVKAVAKNKVYSLPINLHTINQFFDVCLGPKEAENYLKSQVDTSIVEPSNFRDQALLMIGKDLYETFFEGYTRKQWGCSPTELPASVLKRLPVRFNYNDNYFSHKYQGIPKDGYTSIVEKIIDSDRISIHLNTSFSPDKRNKYEHIFYTGPIDAWFDYKYGRLPYRSLVFERSYFDGDYQGNAVINYCDATVPYTRITEHKHFSPWETHAKTVIYKEFSKATEIADEPFYPVRFSGENTILMKYISAAEQEAGVSFLGRLGTFKYLDMDMTIDKALNACKAVSTCLYSSKPIPAFFESPI